MRINIVEDNEAESKRLLSLLRRYEKENGCSFEINAFSDGGFFLASPLKHCDILFLDIELPGGNGMELAEKVRSYDSRVVIIFVTNMAQFAIDGYGVGALDTILTEKQLLCSNENIEFSIMADGKLLSFMKEYDIYSLFGNAIDNAVEALKKIPEEERMLTLSIFEEKNMTVVRMENTFDGTIKTSDGRIQTTKKDDGFHGFGILSMKEIVERYNGLFAWSAKNNLFKITIACKKSSSSQPLTPLTGENM